MKKTICFIASLSLLVTILPSCQKDFLDKKPSQALLVPTTLPDFQALLDYNDIMTTTTGLNNIACDDFYRTEANILSLSAVARNTYLWLPDLFEGSSSNDWNIPYKTVFYANVVLDGLAKVERTAQNQADWDRMKGSALFFRAYAYFHLAQLFAAPYDGRSASTDPGLPLHLTSDVNVIASRGTLQETYDQILKDLQESAPLLPDKAVATNRPSKVSVYGYLARTYLVMENYDKALQSASSYLQITSALIDYNTLTATASRPLPNGGTANANVEVVFGVFLNGYSYDSGTTTYVSPDLFASYSDNDLRKTCFFLSRGSGNYTFKGSYFGSASSFGGPATDEMYLIRAECYARLNKIPEAMQDLNTLMVKRWKKTVPFPTFTATDQTDALRQILAERRKELLTRGLRWSDLRRLNKEPNFAVTLQRAYSGVTYTLNPNSNLYTFPIPPDEIASSGIAQNNRK